LAPRGRPAHGQAERQARRQAVPQEVRRPCHEPLCTPVHRSAPVDFWRYECRENALSATQSHRAAKFTFWLDWPEFWTELPGMKTWPLQEAKNRFSQLVELAETAGPQTVTRHGAPVAVIVSADEYKRMARPKETVLEFLRPLKSSGVHLKRQ